MPFKASFFLYVILLGLSAQAMPSGPLDEEGADLSKPAKCSKILQETHVATSPEMTIWKPFVEGFTYDLNLTQDKPLSEIYRDRFSDLTYDKLLTRLYQEVTVLEAIYEPRDQQNKMFWPSNSLLFQVMQAYGRIVVSSQNGRNELNFSQIKEAHKSYYAPLGAPRVFWAPSIKLLSFMSTILPYRPKWLRVSEWPLVFVKVF